MIVGANGHYAVQAGPAALDMIFLPDYFA